MFLFLILGYQTFGMQQMPHLEIGLHEPSTMSKAICTLLDAHASDKKIEVNFHQPLQMLTFEIICAKIESSITNLTSHDLVMEIMPNLFIHNSYVSHINIVH